MEQDQGKILILEDEASVRRTLERIVQRIGRDCSLAGSIQEAWRLLQQESYELLLCDILLPGESGLDFVEEAMTIYPAMAVIMVTAVDDPETVEKALQLGAYGYIVKPFKVSEMYINISSALRRRQLETESRAYRENLEQIVAKRTTELQETLDGIIKVVARTVESKDPYTAGHQLRVAELASALAREMGLSEERVHGVHMAGLIHDMGKISIPAEILSKPGKLSDKELDLIKDHPQTGYNILQGIEFPWPLAEIVHQHHERMDGSGYPQGLTGERILLEAKIMAVADVVEAMSSYRPYRPGLGLGTALGQIETNQGVLYDKQVSEACLKLFQEQGYSFEELQISKKEAGR